MEGLEDFVKRRLTSASTRSHVMRKEFRGFEANSNSNPNTNKPATKVLRLFPRQVELRRESLKFPLISGSCSNNCEWKRFNEWLKPPLLTRQKMIR